MQSMFIREGNSMELPVGMLQCLHDEANKYIVCPPLPSPIKCELVGVLLLFFFSTLLHNVCTSVHCKAIFNAVSFLN